MVVVKLVVAELVQASKRPQKRANDHDKRMNENPDNMVESIPRRGDERYIGMAGNSGG